MFSALSLRNFKIYWSGMVVSLVGVWIQQVAQSWLVFQLTGSAFYLGLVGFFSFLPIFFFSLFGGIFADRYPKRYLLLVTQSFFMLLAFILGYLTTRQIIQIWHIILIALLNGVVIAFDAPTRQSIVIDLVGKRYLMNAVALNSAAFNAARIIGPALAGILVSSIGMAGCFYINSVSFLAVIIALLSIRIDSKPMINNNSIKKDFFNAIDFIKHRAIIRNLIYMISVSSLFGIWYIILMPIFANDILKIGIKGLGVLMSCNGLGALFAALILAKLGDFQYKGRLLVYSCFAFSIFLCMFALSNNFLLSSILLILLGLTSLLAMAVINTLLQVNVDNAIRGRVMSIFMIAFAGLLPFGNLLAGLITQLVGAKLAVFFGSICCFGFFSLLIIKDKRLYELH